MTRRQFNLSSVVFVLALVFSPLSFAYSTEPQSNASQIDFEVIDLRLNVDLDSFYYDSFENHWIDAVTMIRSPPGSTVTIYEGLYWFGLKHARNRYRRFVRRAEEQDWYIRPDEERLIPLFLSSAERNWTSNHTNGEWWQRNWWESFPADKGGAPDDPYVRVIGKEKTWSLGPISVTNTFKLRVDYIALLEWNPDPVSIQGEEESRFALDVWASRGAEIGTQLRFHLKPHLRIGLPDDENQKAIRELSLRLVCDISRRNHILIECELEIKWRSDSELIVVFDIAFVRW